MQELAAASRYIMCMQRPRHDIVDIDGLRESKELPGTADNDNGKGPRRKFLAVWFRCCHVYGRMYRNAQGSRYEGRCPACGAPVHAIIGPGGTSQRTFEAK